LKFIDFIKKEGRMGGKEERGERVQQTERDKQMYSNEKIRNRKSDR
jgi:hypothetical protein